MSPSSLVEMGGESRSFFLCVLGDFVVKNSCAFFVCFVVNLFVVLSVTILPESLSHSTSTRIE